MKKLALIVQRYGLEINGGSEAYTRMLAEQMTALYETHVITTCAIDYNTWKNEYPSGEEVINGVTVHRFPVDKKRNKKFDAYSLKLYGSPHTLADEEKWIDYQGPMSHTLVEYVKEQSENFDLFFCMTYLYYPTVHCIPLVKEKCVFFPTAHDEPPIYLKIFESLFRSPSAIAYLTQEEKEFVQKKFSNQYIPSDVIGAGIDDIDQDELKSSQEILPNIGKYIIYVGRVDESKGCKELAEYFLQYINETNSDLSLVYVGKSIIELPKSDRIIEMGFVDEITKYSMMKNAFALAMSSRYESLSLVTLESMSLGVPVLANGNCQVLKGHCIRSNGGLYYTSYEEFKAVLLYMETHPEILHGMGINAMSYVQENYTWDRVIKRVERLIDEI